ncbi:MAG TPA: hypothetical protein VMH39_08375, partial [Gemmatimonadaceae bacterium]|nr:hypothetical protein [Gemmatimonadaceae bacterium]
MPAPRIPIACSGQRVDSIAIFTFVPTANLSDSQQNDAVRNVSRAVHDFSRAVHVTTRPAVVRRLLLLQRGDACTELRRTESERLLRSEPFIAEAQVRAFANDHGGVDLDVRTIDEASLVLGGRLEATAPPIEALELGSSNFAGSGMFAVASFQAGEGYRDGFGARLLDADLFGRQDLLAAEADRRPLGGAWDVEASHSFVTDLQRVAWVVRTGSSSDYVTFPTDSSIDRAVRLDRSYFDLGGIARLGRPGHLGLLGGSLSSDYERPSHTPVLVTDSGLAPDVDPTLY